MPMSAQFEQRLIPKLAAIKEEFGTPFHIYDEVGIRLTATELIEAFSIVPSGFNEFFAVKANPNPRIMQIMREFDFGFDCSSIPEIRLAHGVDTPPELRMYTSNNTAIAEFEEVLASGGILNLDDITLLDKLPRMPELICFRYNPGPDRTGNAIIGDPVEAKYGVSKQQIIPAYRKARQMGAKIFGLHTMVCSNELNTQYMIETVRMLKDVIEMIHAQLGIEFEFINMGGGLGIPYRPEDKPLDLELMANEIVKILHELKNKVGFMPKLFMESGRYMAGPHGVLVTQVINQKHIYREYRGVDACMSALMRPAVYGAYHHQAVYRKINGQYYLVEMGRFDEVVDVVGSLCENWDKFAVQRLLPKMQEGDLLVIQDTGAHGHAMGFTYNGRLRPQELLLRFDGSVELIRRAETAEDYFATLNFQPKVLTF